MSRKFYRKIPINQKYRAMGKWKKKYRAQKYSDILFERTQKSYRPQAWNLSITRSFYVLYNLGKDVNQMKEGRRSWKRDSSSVFPYPFSLSLSLSSFSFARSISWHENCRMIEGQLSKALLFNEREMTARRKEDLKCWRSISLRGEKERRNCCTKLCSRVCSAHVQQLLYTTKTYCIRVQRIALC